MKKAKLRKIVVILVVAFAILMSLSISEYAATKMMHEAIMSTYNDLGTEAGIYQVAVNCYVDSDKGLDGVISNSKIYYGYGEKLKVRFSFSREIESYSNLRLGLRYGNGSEKVTTDVKREGSYLVFTNMIGPGDFGGVTITFVEGTVTDTSGNTISIGLLGNQYTWTNTIIAKGAWEGPSISNKTITYPNNQFNIHNEETRNLGGAYVLRDGKVRRMIESDVSIINTTDGTMTEGSRETIEITYALTGDRNAVTRVRPKDGTSLIYIKDVCDIAGNCAANACNITDTAFYVIGCTGNEVNGKYYCKAGTKITFLSILSVHNPQIYIGNAKDDVRELTIVDNKSQDFSSVFISEYVVQEGDNGYIVGKALYGSDNNFGYKYIADTEAPTIRFGGVSVSESGYYSPTIGATDNTNGTILPANETKTTGTIWVKGGFSTEYRLSYTIEDNMTSAQDAYGVARIDRGQGLYDFEINGRDNAGNEVHGLLSDYVTILRDTTGPEISITSNNIMQNEDAIDFKITVDDPNVKDDFKGSGVQRAVNASSVKITNGTIIGSSISDNNLNLRVMPNGDGYISVYVPGNVVADNLRNQSQESDITKVFVDRKAPVVNDVTGVPMEWTKEATLSVVASDDGIGEIQYKFNGGQYSTRNTYRVTENGDVRIQVIDGLGNESEEKIVNITKIDKEPPTIAGIDKKPISQYSTEITIQATDTQSGLAEYSFDGGETWQTSPTKRYTEVTTIRANQLKVKDRVGNIGTYNQEISIGVNATAPIIKLSNNGGEYAIPGGAEIAKVNTTIEVEAQHDCIVYYTVSDSKETEPTSYNSVTGNRVELNIDMPQGTWYLWTYAVDDTSNLTSAKYVSEAFIISPALVFNTGEGSCIRKVETINGVNYVIVPVNTTANDLLKQITSSYDVTIKMSDSNKEVAGDSKLATNQMIVIGSTNQQHRIVVKGDLTGDGIVDIRDLTKMNRYRVEKDTLDKAEFLAGDLIEDGKIDMKDLTKLNQYRLNKINEL